MLFIAPYLCFLWYEAALVSLWYVLSLCIASNNHLDVPCIVMDLHTVQICYANNFVVWSAGSEPFDEL